MPGHDLCESETGRGRTESSVQVTKYNSLHTNIVKNPRKKLQKRRGMKAMKQSGSP